MLRMVFTWLLPIHEQANAFAYKIVRPANRPHQTNYLASWRVNIAGWQDHAIISRTVVDYLRTFDALRVTAARMRAFNASSSILSPS